MNKIREIINTQAYDFLRKEPLKSQIILLGLGGSYAYGTNIEGSDLDIRGIATHTKREILTGHGFEQIVDNTTDTTVYSLEKIVNLLSNCNPNTIEMLGLESWQYLYLSDVGRRLVQNADMFLSKRAVKSFGGYANAQLWRLKNKAIRNSMQPDQERHILNSIESARYSFNEKYPEMDGDIRLYIDKSAREEMNTEIYMDVNIKHYPLRDYCGMWEEMMHITKSYKTIGARNSKAIEHNKLAKHQMHLIRLFLMAFDILEDGKIITYRQKDHDFLMDIRNGKYLDEQEQPTDNFMEIVAEYEDRLKESARRSILPDHPDYERINSFVAEVNEEIVKEG